MLCDNLVGWDREVEGRLKREGMHVCIHTKLLQLCRTFCNPIDYSLPDSSVHGILQARTLEWVAMPPPWDLPDPEIDSLLLSHQGSPEGEDIIILIVNTCYCTAETNTTLQSNYLPI